MIKIFKVLFVLVILLMASYSWAQFPVLGYYNDAALYSRNLVSGTARFQGLGGAGTALGADLSSAALNPAGLGFYRKSEFGISSGLGFTSSSATYLDEPNRDNRGYFFFPNFGVAFSNAKDDIEEGAWRGGTFAITYNRLNNLQTQTFISGNNYNNTFITNIIEKLNATGQPVDDFDVPQDEIYDPLTLFYMSFLTEYDYDLLEFYNPFDTVYNEQTGMYEVISTSIPNYQEQVISTRGGQNQFDFSYGGNFSDRFYLGAGLGIVSVRNVVTKDFYEETLDSSGLRNFTFTEEYTTRGTGINFKIGFIARPIDALRIGLTLQTPTVYALTENYRYGLLVNFAPNYTIPFAGYQPGMQSNKTVPLDFKYRLTTPPIIRGGIAYIIEKYGFLTADIEYIPYGSMSLRDKTDLNTFKGDNRFIKNNFSNVLNYKLGGEYRTGIFRLRGGFGYIGSPLNDFDNIDRSIYTYTGGAGIKMPSYYFDLALTHARSKGFYQPYTLASGNAPASDIAYRNTQFIITFGSYF